MKFLFINYALETFTPTQSGALATIIRECSLAAMQQGFQPTVLTCRSTAQPYTDIPTLMVDPPRQPKTRFGVLTLRAERKLFSHRHMGHRGYIRRVIQAIGQAHLDGVPMILQNDPELACNLRSAFPNARIVHWFQNQHSSKERFRRSFGYRIDRVAAVSDFTARWIESHYNLPAGSVKTIHNGVNVSEFSPAQSVPSGKPIINFVGRTGIEKAPDTVLRAAIELSKERTDFAIQLLGSNHWDRFEMDGYQRQLVDLAGDLEKRGVEVRRPGFIDRFTLPSELRKASIHVVPSRWEEPCALTIFEGLATGIPVVASRTGGTPEIVLDAGLLFERDNVVQLTNHFRALVADPELRKTYGQKARYRAEQLSWKQTWMGLRSLIED